MAYKTRCIKAVDLAVLLANLHKASQEKDIGFEHAHETLSSFIRQINKDYFIELGRLEDALWSSNLLDERGKFWHPENIDFTEFLRRLLGSATKYNRKLCTIKGD